MIVDARAVEFHRRRTYYHAFVDGREIPGAAYADTDAGFVRTLMILFDATDEVLDNYPDFTRNSKIQAKGFDRRWLPPEWEIEEWDAATDHHVVLSRIIRGNVTIKPFQLDQRGQPVEIQ